MSTEITKDIICPQCGEPQKYRLFAGVNAQDNPELKEKILEETLFDWRCQRCNYFAAMAYPFLYTDPEKKLLVCVTPAGSKSNVQPSPAVEEFTKRQVKNLAELKEKILIFDGGYDDVAVELVKNALCTIIKDSYKVNRVHAYFSRVNQDEMEFAIFLPRKAYANQDHFFLFLLQIDHTRFYLVSKNSASFAAASSSGYSSRYSASSVFALSRSPSSSQAAIRPCFIS